MIKRRLRAALCLVLVTGLAACASHKPAPSDLTPSPIDIRQQADLAWQYGDYATAVQRYRDLLAAEPGNRGALIGLGEAWLALGNAVDARDAFEQVLAKEPAATDALEGRGLARLGLGNDAGAEADFRAVLGTGAKRWRALNGLGMVFDLRGRYDESKSWYEQALAVQPGEATIWNDYGWSRVMARDYATAEKLIGEALARKPNQPRFVANLAVAIAWQGDYDRAVRTAMRTAEEHVACNDVGYIALLREDYPAAERWFQRAIDTSPVWFERAAINLERARREEAAAKSAAGK